jgi:electron transfer flavoprotein alpha subunit
MKALLIGESREGRLLDSTYELLGFAALLEADTAMFLVGSDNQLPAYCGRLYLADAGRYGEYNPDLHRELILEAVLQEQPDYVIFSHSSYGWDLAPRVAASLRVAQLSEVVALADEGFELCCCNSRMRRTVKPATAKAVLTIQARAFAPFRPGGTPRVERLETKARSSIEFIGYEAAEVTEVDLGGAEVIVGVGRGVGKKENIALITALASALGGEVGATRPVVDAGWMEKCRQVGATGQTVAPKLYLACGISGAIQHLAGMKSSGFIVAINRDRDAPIAEVADVLVVADVVQLLPALMERLKNRCSG